MAPAAVNKWAVFRFALAYPDEQHFAQLSALFVGVPDSLEKLQANYVELFEAGLPQPRCPLLESAYLLNRPAGDVVLENKLFYQHFGLEIDTGSAPDHLLTQLEFLAWLDHAIEAGNPDSESMERARREFIERHLSHWIGKAAGLAAHAGAGCYADLLDALAGEVEADSSFSRPPAYTPQQ